MQSKLVLFDIDDTLVVRTSNREVGLTRWQKAIQDVFGITISLECHPQYSGWVDYQIGTDLVKPFKIGKTEFDRKFPQIADRLFYHANIFQKGMSKQYRSIQDAVSFVRKINISSNIYITLLTGNLEKVGWWKLREAGIENLFTWGLFSDKFKTREDIAKAAFDQAQKKTGIRFTPHQVTVIGDSIYDIRCGKAICAQTIGYCRIRPDDRKKLVDEKSDLVTENLNSSEVLKLITGE